MCTLAKKVREAVPGNYGLVVNTGEFGPLEARAMIASGIDVVYHSLRLGEGRTTCFRPEERKATLSAVRDSDLELAHLVEPVGPEHTDDEIADVLMTALSNGAALSGAMARRRRQEVRPLNRTLLFRIFALPRLWRSPVSAEV